MSAFDDWLATDPNVEAECPNCGGDLRFVGDSDGCTCDGAERPGYPPSRRRLPR